MNASTAKAKNLPAKISLLAVQCTTYRDIASCVRSLDLEIVKTAEQLYRLPFRYRDDNFEAQVDSAIAALSSAMRPYTAKYAGSRLVRVVRR